MTVHEVGPREFHELKLSNGCDYMWLQLADGFVNINHDPAMQNFIQSASPSYCLYGFLFSLCIVCINYF